MKTMINLKIFFYFFPFIMSGNCFHSLIGILGTLITTGLIKHQVWIYEHLH